ncbi:YicC family protein [Sporolactobacillus sp. THM7-7]|nr:YicC family protein [Sporolactobacillus sp. THM7-7]
MLKSMTGFGMAERNDGETQVRVELKSVNHRFFDLSYNIPRPFVYLEDKIKKVIRTYIQRGALSLFITIEGSEVVAPTIETNWQMVDKYIEAAKAIQKRCGGGDWDYSRILALPGVFSIQEAGAERARVLEPMILETVEEASRRLTDMRRAEGDQLRMDLEHKLSAIERQVDELYSFVPQVRAHYEERLRKNVTDFLGAHQGIDEQRLLSEVAVFADKSAVDEELTRMRSHLNQCRKLLNESRPVGRQLDFLIQEMNREMNTIGSKGNHAGISRMVVAVKSEIEKLREQVQNVE